MMRERKRESCCRGKIVCVCVCPKKERSSSDRLPLADTGREINDLPVICNCFKLVVRKKKGKKKRITIKKEKARRSEFLDEEKTTTKAK
jgi:hypothetical protein